MFGFGDGWHEPEYNPATARAWRWMSERARLWVRPVGRDVTLTIAGESPLRYFDRAPKVRVVAAGIELAQFTPPAISRRTITIPAKALTLAPAAASRSKATVVHTRRSAASPPIHGTWRCGSIRRSTVTIELMLGRSTASRRRRAQDDAVRCASAPASAASCPAACRRRAARPPRSRAGPTAPG